MHQPPQGESLWGTINTAIEIAIDLYMVIATDEAGVEHTGVMARKGTAVQNLSPKAVSMAEQDGEWLCYDENSKDIPVYEALQQRMATCKRMEAAVIKQMEEIKRDGKLSLADYFGECNPPTETPNGNVVDRLAIRNGVYFTHDNTSMGFAVHEAIADNYMSDSAVAFGRRQGDYLYYDLTSCAVAMNELKNVFSEVDALVVSQDSLNATLNQRFKTYVSQYNALMPEDDRIPEANAPESLFLAVQLAAAKEAGKKAPDDQHDCAPQEPDFHEESDFEVR